MLARDLSFEIVAARFNGIRLEPPRVGGTALSTRLKRARRERATQSDRARPGLRSIFHRARKMTLSRLYQRYRLGAVISGDTPAF